MFPSSSDYILTIQTKASTAFKTLNKLRFSSIFAHSSRTVVLKAEYNGRQYAIKCLTDAEEKKLWRYRDITSYLQAVNQSWTTQIEILENEIEVNGNLYPIIKMDWVNGLQLNKYVAQNLNNNNALNDLQEDLLILSHSLESHWIAHGNINCRNVLIAPGPQGKPTIKLIGYDDMYIPSFPKGPTPIQENQAFEHHLLQQQPYDQTFDRFSFWVIVCAIEAIKYVKSLWLDVSQGGYNTQDNFLFVSNDFKHVHQSKLVALLRAINQPSLQYYVDKLEQFCLGNPNQIEPLFLYQTDSAMPPQTPQTQPIDFYIDQPGLQNPYEQHPPTQDSDYYAPPPPTFEPQPNYESTYPTESDRPTTKNLFRLSLMAIGFVLLFMMLYWYATPQNDDQVLLSYPNTATQSSHQQQAPIIIDTVVRHDTVWIFDFDKTHKLIYSDTANKLTKPDSQPHTKVSSSKIERKKMDFEPEMVFIKGGTFQMGNDKGLKDEKPAHTVSLSSYSIGKYEITVAQWEAVMGKGPHNINNCENCPVQNIKIEDIESYIILLNGKTAMQYRLPTEAEWEFAARGGTLGMGNENTEGPALPQTAWYYGNSAKKAHPVGLKSPNSLGLYDMIGNVWECCSDWYAAYPSTPQKDPKGPEIGRGCVIRGGSYNTNNVSCNPFCRHVCLYGRNYGSIGFRLAYSTSPQ